MGRGQGSGDQGERLMKGKTKEELIKELSKSLDNNEPLVGRVTRVRLPVKKDDPRSSRSKKTRKGP